MQVKISGVEKVYEAPPGCACIYDVSVLFHNKGRAIFQQSFIVPPRVGETWEMPQPQLTRITHFADGSER